LFDKVKGERVFLKGALPLFNSLLNKMEGILNLGRIPSSKAKNIKRGVWGDKDFKMKIMGCLRGTAPAG